mmetsp:Transcript_5693/g.16958  ORF Transcript_5693/g.16958 Transcript_5693/m.16958 type:complete len:209 (-) Transcript_5693:61-687(-)
MWRTPLGPWWARTSSSSPSTRPRAGLLQRPSPSPPGIHRALPPSGSRASVHLKLASTSSAEQPRWTQAPSTLSSRRRNSPRRQRWRTISSIAYRPCSPRRMRRTTRPWAWLRHAWRREAAAAKAGVHRRPRARRSPTRSRSPSLYPQRRRRLSPRSKQRCQRRPRPTRRVLRRWPPQSRPLSSARSQPLRLRRMRQRTASRREAPSPR